MVYGNELADIARDLVVKGKGILAADESSPTMQKRFDSIGVESTLGNRRDYREMLFKTEGSNEFISGVILYDETVRQSGSDGEPLIETLQNQGIIPGIKVDKSTKPLAGSDGELVTEGLDGLRQRLMEYRELGAKFTKWRAVISIGDSTPTLYCIRTNAQALARYAVLSQEAGLVPIVEPEVLMDGNHDIDRCFSVTELTLREVFYELSLQCVRLEGMLLKPNMVISGKSAINRAPAGVVGKKTITCFKRVVPAAVPGIVFLSGGQGDDEAIDNLNSINKVANCMGAPWELSFSFGRGLQALPLKAWKGDTRNFAVAQRAYYSRAKVTGLARDGRYSSNDNE
jgi:fructose-bisphosphate aldolase class I